MCRRRVTGKPIGPVRLGVAMSELRLLVALRPREDARAAVSQRLPGIPWGYLSETSPSEWTSAEALLLGSVERDLGKVDLRPLESLRFVQRVYTGMDGVPFDRFPKGVRFAGNVGAYAPFVAEHAVALALAAAREVPRAHSLVAAGTLRPPPSNRLLWRQCATILGYGEIGRAIADRLQPFEMHIGGVNRTGRMAPGCSGMFPADRLVDSLRGADFVFDSRPLTRLTESTIDRTALEAMKPTAVFVNIGRAGTVREEDLYRHLQSHPEFRAGLDVWWHEDFAAGRIEHRWPFPELPNFVGTPHCAGFGPGVDSYVLDQALANLARFFAGQDPRYVVDPSEYATNPTTQ